MAELVRRVDRIEREVNTALGRIEARLDARVMSVDVYQAEKLAMQIQLGAVERRINELEEGRQTNFRLITAALLGFVFNVVGLLVVYLITRGT